jgi:hypothetical protein
MILRKVVIKLIQVFSGIAILACYVQANSSQIELITVKQDAGVEMLQNYLQMRLRNADWKEYSKFITWPDEPSWDCNWVVSKYEIRTAKKEDNNFVIPVVFNRLGLFCYDYDFNQDPKEVTINYELIELPSGWKVKAPIPDYPEISADELIKALRASAEDSKETPERRARYSATARKVEKALR